MRRPLTSLLLGTVLVLGIGVFLPTVRAAEHKAAAPTNPPAPVKVEVKTAPAAAPAGAALAIEKKDLATSSASKEITVKKFRKNTPRNFKKLGMTEEQVKKLVAIQAEYFTVMAPLEARLARLRAERDLAVQGVLTAEQQKKWKELAPPKTEKTPKAPKKTADK